MLQLNWPADWATTCQTFAEGRRINLPAIWPVETAEQIGSTLAQQTAFDHVIVNGPSILTLSDAQLHGMPPPELQRLQHQLLQGASNGYGFYYGMHRIDRKEPYAATPALLHAVHQLLNSEAVLQRMRELSGFQDICYASAQATRYQHGNFLTRHNDRVEQEGRRLAYVFGFTPQWHPDWGGLLQFFTQEGQTLESWTPTFNNMAVFDVMHPHSVTYVTPFSRGARFSITGWFRAIKPQAPK